MTLRFSSMMLTTALILIFPGLSVSKAATLAGCTTAADYIATLEFLREQKGIVPEEQARKIATQVSKGCSGSAQRFIRVFQLLSRAGLHGTDAAREAIAFSTRTDREAETFITVFQKAYLREYLDLDLSSSIQMAKSLSTEFEGDVLGVRSDFERLVEFCVSAKELDLPRPRCGTLAARLARLGQNHSGGIADDFISVFEFSTSEQGPGVPTLQALNIAERVVSAGPGAGQNFVAGFRYAASKRGLNVSNEKALEFAIQLASGTTR